MIKPKPTHDSTDKSIPIEIGFAILVAETLGFANVLARQVGSIAVKRARKSKALSNILKALCLASFAGMIASTFGIVYPVALAFNAEYPANEKMTIRDSITFSGGSTLVAFACLLICQGLCSAIDDQEVTSIKAKAGTK